MSFLLSSSAAHSIGSFQRLLVGSAYFTLAICVRLIWLYLSTLFPHYEACLGVQCVYTIYTWTLRNPIAPFSPRPSSSSSPCLHHEHGQKMNGPPSFGSFESGVRDRGDVQRCPPWWEVLPGLLCHLSMTWKMRSRRHSMPAGRPLKPWRKA